LLKDKGVNEQIFKDLQNKNKLKFDFKDKSYPGDLVEKISSNMKIYPLEDVLI